MPAKRASKDSSITRTYKTVPADILESTRTALEYTNAELSAALGCSDTFVSTCLRRGTAPAWAELACKGLLNGQKVDSLIVARIPSRHRDTIESLFKNLGINYTKF